MRRMKHMMESMMGEGHGPMRMMHKMMDKMSQSAGEGDMPWDMCHNMMSSFQEHVEATKFATPELRQLFEEWVEQIEQELLQFVEQAGHVDPEKIAEHFKLSKESVIFLLTRLAKQGKIQFETKKNETT